jgi:hypothetical protein
MNTKLKELKRLFAQDKRKTDRLRLPIRIFCFPASCPNWQGPVLIRDISGQGVRFLSVDKLKTGSEVAFKIEFPEFNNPRILVKSKIIWCKELKTGGYEIGVNFNKMELSDRRRYVEYITEKILEKYLKI